MEFQAGAWLYVKLCYHVNPLLIVDAQVLGSTTCTDRGDTDSTGDSDQRAPLRRTVGQQCHFIYCRRAGRRCIR